MAELKIGIVGIPGAWSTEILAARIESQTGFRCVIDFTEVHVDLDKKSISYAEHDLATFDALIVKKISRIYSPTSVDRLHILNWLSERGVRVFSNPQSMAELVNRLGCTLKLSAANIPMPKTSTAESVDVAMQILQDYQSAVFKPLFSTKARGMCVINYDDKDARDKVTTYHQENPLMYIQQKIDMPDRDLGLMFLGGEYIGTYARVSSGDSWNTTTEAGGKYACHEPHADTIALAKKAQACFDLAYTVVDIVEAEDSQQSIVFEVSAFGGFRGAQEGCGIDVAQQYAEYVIKQLK